MPPKITLLYVIYFFPALVHSRHVTIMLLTLIPNFFQHSLFPNLFHLLANSSIPDYYTQVKQEVILPLFLKNTSLLVTIANCFGFFLISYS